MPLTEKMKAFAKHYCVLEGNKTQAAIAAGYPESNARKMGWKLARHPEISALIRKTMDKALEKLDLDFEDMLAEIDEVKYRCMQGEPVYDQQGRPTGMWQFDSRGALKAIELQAKLTGRLNDKQVQEHTGNITVTVKRVGFDAKKPPKPKS